MTIRLHDTRAQQLRDFVPLDDSNVTMYVCGPTVQSGPHIGHVRAALSFDLLRRWLERHYGRVTFVRNVTDIDDKVLENATDDEPWWALAYRMEQEFSQAYAAIGILAPTYEPRATGFIPQMHEVITRLIDRGHAYAAPDGSGDVYFDVRSWPAYGELTHQSVDAMETQEPALESVEGRGKRNPQDFALWKGAKADEQTDATWASPWGAGRPGWHIECSAMSKRFLGAEFDIHGGGLDLRFPHHENELAQSTAAGDGFARYWMHNGLVTVNGQKMSKSLGNFTPAADVLAQHDPLVVRYALAAAHYRSSLDLSESSWAEADAALGRIQSFLERAERAAERNETRRRRRDTQAADDASPSEGEVGEYIPLIPVEFAAALDDDLGVPQALAVMHERVRRGNQALDDGDDASAERALFQVRAMVGVLGLDGVSAPSRDSGAAASALDTLAKTMITQRAQARADKDWAAADRIRDAVAAAGIILEDTPDGTHWSIDG